MQIAVIDFTNGVVTGPHGDVVHQREQTRTVAVVEKPAAPIALNPIDEFNLHLAKAIKLAQGMSDADKRRASEVMEAARGALTMVTRLSTSEQRRFEAALRAAASE